MAGPNATSEISAAKRVALKMLQVTPLLISFVSTSASNLSSGTSSTSEALATTASIKFDYTVDTEC